MVRKDLLNKELKWYKEHGFSEMKSRKFNKNYFYKLLKKYKFCGMTENSYCCYGEEHCCWQELVEDGVWDLTYKSVRYSIWDLIKSIRHELRCKKYGDRLYMYEDKDNCYVYIYARDTDFKNDYFIWFSNKED